MVGRYCLNRRDVFVLYGVQRFLPDFSLEMGSVRFIFFGNTAKFHYCLCRRSGGGMEIEMNEKTLYIKNARIVRGDGRVPEAGGVIVSYADGKGTNIGNRKGESSGELLNIGCERSLFISGVCRYWLSFL